MADEDAKKWLSCLGWGCLAVVVISVVGIGGCVAFLYQGGSEAHAVANAYLDAVEAGDFETAFLSLGPEFTERRGMEELVAFEQAARAEMRSCGEWQMGGTSFNRESGRSMAQLTYRRMCDEGPVTAAVSLEQVDGEWVIQDIRYNEPVGPVVEVCAGCSAVIPPGANYCPVCGTAVGDGAEDSEQPKIEAPAGAEGDPEPDPPSSGPPE